MMRREMPQIQEFMTPTPHAISATTSVTEAHRRMRSPGIGHLPVVDGKSVGGVLTERTVAMVYDRPDFQGLQVGDVMIAEPYCVFPQTPLDGVAAEREDFG